MARIINSKRHQAEVITSYSVITARIYPSGVNIKKAIPLIIMNVSTLHPTAGSLMARSLAVLMDDLDSAVDKAGSERS